MRCSAKNDFEDWVTRVFITINHIVVVAVNIIGLKLNNQNALLTTYQPLVACKTIVEDTKVIITINHIVVVATIASLYPD